MLHIEELKARIHALVDETSSEEGLEKAIAALTSTHVRLTVSEAEEQRHAISRQQIKEGKGITLAEFEQRSDERIQARATQ